MSVTEFFKLVRFEHALMLAIAVFIGETMVLGHVPAFSTAIILSLLVLISIGYFSGLGFTYLADIFNNIYVAIGFILLIIVIIVAAQLWLKKRFTDVES